VIITLFGSTPDYHVITYITCTEVELSHECVLRTLFWNSNKGVQTSPRQVLRTFSNSLMRTAMH